MKQANVYMYQSLAGVLIEDEAGFHFQYSVEYLTSPNAEAISLTLPLQSEVYHNDNLFAFFDGLIPEGWLLEIAVKNWKINYRDRMSLLLATCHDCIGAVSVIPINDNK